MGKLAMVAHGPHGALQGWRILVVEDDWFEAEDLHRELEREGAEVLGPVPGVARALDVLVGSLRPTAALLDVRLGGEVVYPVADLLRSLAVPFAFVTACLHRDLPPAYAAVPFCPKPVALRQLVRAMKSLTVHASR